MGIGLENAYIKGGFRDSKEAIILIGSVDLSSEEKVKRFKKWQHEDFTKKGLLKVLQKNK